MSPPTPETSTKVPAFDFQSPLPRAKGAGVGYWLQQARADPLLDHRTTKGLPERAEVVIIGSGLSGNVLALELLRSAKPPKSIVMLEAREFCSGATGRNAGHCKPDVYRGFLGYEETFGDAQALRILQNEQATFKAVCRFVEEHAVQCDFWQGQTYDVYMTRDALSKGEQSFQAYKQAGGDVSMIIKITNADEAEKISKVKGALAVYSWPAASLDPWKLASHVAGMAIDLGMNLQTWTPALGVESAKDGSWIVRTPRGKIITPSVVYASNAYTSAILPELTGLVAPIPHMCDMVIPPASHSGSNRLQNTYAVIGDDNFYTINPRSSDGSILFGGWSKGVSELYDHVAESPRDRSADDSIVNFQPITQSVKELCQKGLGWSEDSYGSQPICVRSWSGIIGEAVDGVPLVGKVPGPPGRWISAGHCGHGMARIMTTSAGLAKLMQGARWSDTNLPEVFELTEERLKRYSRMKGVLTRSSL